MVRRSTRSTTRSNGLSTPKAARPPRSTVSETSPSLSSPRPAAPQRIRALYDPLLDAPRQKYLLGRYLLPIDPDAAIIHLPLDFSANLVSRSLPLPRTTNSKDRKPLRESLKSHGFNDAEYPLVLVLTPPTFSRNEAAQTVAKRELIEMSPQDAATRPLSVESAQNLEAVVLVGRSRWLELVEARGSEIEHVHVEVYTSEVFTNSDALYTYFVTDTNDHAAFSTVTTRPSLSDLLSTLIVRRSAGIERSTANLSNATPGVRHALYSLTKSRLSATLVSTALSSYPPFRILLSSLPIDAFRGIFNHPTLGESSPLVHHQLLSTCRFLQAVDPELSLSAAFWFHFGRFSKSLDLVNPLAISHHSPTLALSSSDSLVKSSRQRQCIRFMCRIMAMKLRDKRRQITTSRWAGEIGSICQHYYPGNIGLSLSPSDSRLVRDCDHPVALSSFQEFETQLDSFIELLLNFDPLDSTLTDLADLSPTLFTFEHVTFLDPTKKPDPRVGFFEIAKVYVWKPLVEYLESFTHTGSSGFRLDQLVTLALAEQDELCLKKVLREPTRLNSKSDNVAAWSLTNQQTLTLESLYSFVGSPPLLEQLATSQYASVSVSRSDSTFWRTPAWKAVATILLRLFPELSSSCRQDLEERILASESVKCSPAIEIRAGTTFQDFQDRAKSSNVAFLGRSSTVSTMEEDQVCENSIGTDREEEEPILLDEDDDDDSGDVNSSNVQSHSRSKTSSSAPSSIPNTPTPSPLPLTSRSILNPSSATPRLRSDSLSSIDSPSTAPKRVKSHVDMTLFVPLEAAEVSLVEVLVEEEEELVEEEEEEEEIANVQESEDQSQQRLEGDLEVHDKDEDVDDEDDEEDEEDEAVARGLIRVQQPPPTDESSSSSPAQPFSASLQHIQSPSALLGSTSRSPSRSRSTSSDLTSTSQLSSKLPSVAISTVQTPPIPRSPAATSASNKKRPPSPPEPSPHRSSTRLSNKKAKISTDSDYEPPPHDEAEEEEDVEEVEEVEEEDERITALQRPTRSKVVKPLKASSSRSLTIRRDGVNAQGSGIDQDILQDLPLVSRLTDADRRRFSTLDYETLKNLDLGWNRLSLPTKLAAANRDVLVILFRVFWDWYQRVAIETVEPPPPQVYRPQYYVDLFIETIDPTSLNFSEIVRSDSRSPPSLPFFSCSVKDDPAFYSSYLQVHVLSWALGKRTTPTRVQARWINTLEDWNSQIEQLFSIPPGSFVDTVKKAQKVIDTRAELF
ncbi:hypothetical protein JCM5350_007930 [Sporobolomyces pararoseus]